MKKAPLALLATSVFLASCSSGMVQPETPILPNPSIQLDSGTTSSVSTGNTAAPQTITRDETLSYRSPDGIVPVEFAVTVTDGIITTATATPKAEQATSKEKQTAFANALSQAVVGKKAKDLSVDAIGGASLTTAAFETFVHGF